MATPARIRANTKYQAKAYDKITLRMKKGEREKIQAAATAAGESLNAFIVKAVNQRMNGGSGDDFRIE